MRLRHWTEATFTLLLSLLWLVGCGSEMAEVTPQPAAAISALPTPPVTPQGAAALPQVPTATPFVPSTMQPGSPPAFGGAPTPDPPRPTPDQGMLVGQHVVAFGETLATVAMRYGTSVEELISLNGLADPNALSAGQTLLIPSGADVVGPTMKLIPDSELVYSPSARNFDVTAVARANGGFLRMYEEEVEGARLSGPAVVQLVADRFQVHPRLLLVVLEHRSGWVTRAEGVATDRPLGYGRAGYAGLYQQLSWAANKLNWGYYGLQEGGLESFTVADGTRVGFAAGINAGTAGVQLLLAAVDNMTYDGWLREVGPDGFWATYSRMFGNPFSYTVDPLWPDELTQPELSLPWGAGETWYFTGGPHGGWAPGSAWAALDFVPGGDRLGCYDSDEWVRATADGVVARSEMGAVVVDLDGDGFVGTGWAIHYVHLATRDRVAVGTLVKTGDPLGHPSCEGGYSLGTHVHISRTYNGRWVSADGQVPLVMDGWVTQGLGREYDGYLVRGEEVREACGTCRTELNEITAAGSP